MATVLIQNGTLSLRDVVVTGATYGRIRAMNDDRGRKVRQARPSMPVEILGLLETPEAGDPLQVVSDEREARTIAEERRLQRRVVRSRTSRCAWKTGKQCPERADEGTADDHQGRRAGLARRAPERDQQAVTEGQHNVICGRGVGAITESDVTFAATSSAIVIGFNVRPDAAAQRAANARGVDIRFYNVIYTWWTTSRRR